MLRSKTVFAPTSLVRAYQIGASALAMTCAAGSAWAQTPGQTPAPAPAASQGNAVSELVVTAQKREQRLQDVPVVVTVLSGAKLAANNVNSVADLVTLTPGLTSTTNGTEGTTIARIRGVAPSVIPPFTSRPPLAPTPIKLLANAPDAYRFEDDKK